MFAGKKETVDQELIEKLKNYVIKHFRFEEGIMRSKGYDGIKHHQKQHRYFESVVQDFESAHQNGKDEKLSSALMLLRDWFLNHILDEDRKFFSKYQ